MERIPFPSPSLRPTHPHPFHSPLTSSPPPTQGASAVGLTAGVHMDPMTKEWTLEGGALVSPRSSDAIVEVITKQDVVEETRSKQFLSLHKNGFIALILRNLSDVIAKNSTTFTSI